MEVWCELFCFRRRRTRIFVIVGIVVRVITEALSTWRARFFVDGKLGVATITGTASDIPGHAAGHDGAPRGAIAQQC